MFAVSIKNFAQGIGHRNDGFPSQFFAGIGDLGNAILYVLVAIAVIDCRSGCYQLYLACRIAVLRVFLGQFQHHGSQVPDGIIVGRIADVVNFAGSDTIFICNDLHQCGYTIVDISECAFLLPTVYQIYIFAAHDVAEELCQYARTSFFRRVDGVQSSADPVEGTEEGKV